MSIRVILFVLFTSICGYLMGTVHPIHISMCEIAYNEKSQALEVSQRIFIDDLELGMENSSLLTEKIGDSLTVKNLEIIELYIAQKMKFFVNNQLIDFHFLGAEIEEDALWCYFEIKPISKLLNFELSNTILLDIYDDQKNIVHFKNDGLTKTFLFHKEMQKQVILRN